MFSWKHIAKNNNFTGASLRDYRTAGFTVDRFLFLTLTRICVNLTLQKVVNHSFGDYKGQLLCTIMYFYNLTVITRNFARNCHSCWVSKLRNNSFTQLSIVKIPRSVMVIIDIQLQIL